jgi:hypothetical protein
LLLVAGGIVALYLLSAYVVLPLAWTHREHRPRLATMPDGDANGAGHSG